MTPVETIGRPAAVVFYTGSRAVFEAHPEGFSRLAIDLRPRAR